jgi:small subunit ribosomal protein S9
MATDSQNSDFSEDVPDLSSTLDIGSESVESAEPAPHFDPIIRGKIDRFGVAWGTGRRKTAVARVRVKDGSGKCVVNGRPVEEYFPVERDLGMIQAPLKATDTLGKVDIEVSVEGGGPTGQTGAVVLGIARALQAKNPQLHPMLSEGGFLTRDSRMVERKKYGKKKARRSFQFSKR